MTEQSFARGLVGVTLDGRYRLDAVLGEGGMGSVFRATQLAMERKVAVKLLKPHLTGDRVALERFSREARATMKVDSPHAVKVVDFGVTPLGDYYMVLEYLDGRTVQRELEIDGPFAPARVAHIARQALHALGVAHAQGLIHRDVKPENLLLMRAGADGDYTKVLDFGVAKLMQGAAGDPAALALTAAGMVFGTPEFMSPEQACGQPLDGRSDLYSLAATMFVMLTGTTLFEGTTAIEWLTHHVRTPAPQLAMVRPELAAYPELDALVQRCLAKPREQRPATAADLAGLLAEIEPTLSRPPASAEPRTSSKPSPVHASGYVQMLREPPALTAPVLGASPAAMVDSAATTGVPGGATPRRRRLGLWLGGIAAAATASVAIAISLQNPGGDSAAPPGESAGREPSAAAVGREPSAVGREPSAVDREPKPIAAGSEPGPVAAVREPGPATASAAREPSPTAAVREPKPVAAPGGAPARRPAQRTVAAPRSAVRTSPAKNPEAEALLRDAEAAAQANQTLRQLSAADLALRADPDNVRARYLLGDALIKSGDIEKGCKYLAELKRVATARERARSAGCAGN